MAKKNKSNSARQPNAPELQQIFLDSPNNYQPQPSHNPYYPSLSEIGHQPPPPYSDLSGPKPTTYPTQQLPATNSVPMARIAPGASYSRFTNSAASGAAAGGNANHQPTVIVQAQANHYDHRREKYNAKIKRFNNEMIIIALSAMISSIYANKLFEDRPCVEEFIIHKPIKDAAVRIKDLHQAQMSIAYCSIMVFIVCLAKCGNTRAKSHSCYLFLLGLTTFILTLSCGYLSYLAFYSPCTRNLYQQASGAIKTFAGIVTSSDLPPASQRLFGETTILDWVDEDRKGFGIFIINMLNCIMYLGSFLAVARM